MTPKELDRLVHIEKRVREIAEEYGLIATDIIFEIVPAQRVLEGMSYMFPANFSHWTFGRDYEKNRTRYEHTGGGIPYEQVWNFEVPRAFLVETNPLALNAMILAHVYGHVDFFRGSRYMKHGRAFSDIAEEARAAAKRFAGYEERYGKEAVERVIDAAMAIMLHQNPDPFFEVQDEEATRARLIAYERAKLERANDIASEFKKPLTSEEIERIEKNLILLEEATPPEPEYDVLHYVLDHLPGRTKSWVHDVLTVVRNQTRALAPNRRTKMLNEGWATYWHVQITRRLFEEGLLTPEEHGTFNHYHPHVAKEDHLGFNPYFLGLKIFEYTKERWDKGQFGREYDESTDLLKRSRWDTHAGKGREKIFEVRAGYSDRMAIEDLFTDGFIHEHQLYMYSEEIDMQTGESVLVVEEDDPVVIRAILKLNFTHYGVPLVYVKDGNRNSQGNLYLVHVYTGYDLDSKYRDGTLEKIHSLWGRVVMLEAQEEGKVKLFTFNGKEHKSRDMPS